MSDLRSRSKVWETFTINFRFFSIESIELLLLSLWRIEVRGWFCLLSDLEYLPLHMPFFKNSFNLLNYSLFDYLRVFVEILGKGATMSSSVHLTLLLLPPGVALSDLLVWQMRPSTERKGLKISGHIRKDQSIIR